MRHWATRLAVLPRAATVTAASMFVVHTLASASGRGAPATRPSEWLLLAVADLGLLGLVLLRPHRFRVRNFRLPGVAVVAIGWITLIPLPSAMERFRLLAPPSVVVSIAVGTAALWAVVALVPLSPSRPDPPRAWIRRRGKMPFFLVTVAGIAVGVLGVWLASIGDVPVLRLLAGRADVASLAESRQSAFREIPSTALRLAVGILRNYVLPFTAAWFCADWAVRRRTGSPLANRSLVLFLGSALLSLAFALVTTEKSLLAQLTIVVAVAWLTAQRRSLTAGMLAAIGAVGMSFPLFVYGAVNPGSLVERVETAVAGVHRRIFFLPDDVLLRYFATFPEIHEHLGGASIPKLGRIIDGSTFDLSAFIFQLHYARPGGIAGNANGSFLGSGWANFGPAGIVVWCLLAGFAVILIERFISGRISERSSAALRAVMVVQVIFLTQQDVFRTVLGVAPGVLDLLVVVWLAERVMQRSPAAPAPLPRAAAFAPGG